MENNPQPQSVQPQVNLGVNPAPVNDNPIPMSQAPIQPQPVAQPEEDHRTILERITGIFNKGKKEEVQAPPAEIPTPPPVVPQQ